MTTTGLVFILENDLVIKEFKCENFLKVLNPNIFVYPLQQSALCYKNFTLCYMPKRIREKCNYSLL